jgi:hypothetical protein
MQTPEVPFSALRESREQYYGLLKCPPKTRATFSSGKAEVPELTHSCWDLDTTQSQMWKKMLSLLLATNSHNISRPHVLLACPGLALFQTQI